MNLPPYNLFPKLMDSGVILREIEASDIESLLEISFYDGRQAASLGEAEEMHQKIIMDYKNGNSIHWGIIERKNGKIAGTCGYYRGFENSTGELGCILLSGFRGLGLMSSAMRLAISYGIREIELKRISATTTSENLQAIKLLERLGFVVTKKGLTEIEYELPRNIIAS